MFRRIAITLLMVAVCAQMAPAATRYHTQRLADMARAAGLSLPGEAAAGMCDDSTYTFRGRPLRVRTNSFGDISHIGYRLFSPQLMEAYGASPVFNFIERYLLELDLSLDGRTPAARMDIDRIVTTAGDISMLHTMAADAAFSIETITRRMYRLKWAAGARTLSITIPADCQLLAGANAIELEEIFERDLQRIIPMDGDEFIGGWDKAKVARSEGLLIVDGGTFMSEMIRGDVYLTEHGGHRRLVADASKPRQSVANIMLTGCYGRTIPLDLTIDRYGYKSSKVAVTVQQFVSYCLAEGCKLYFGVKTNDGERITGTLFALNDNMACNHVLRIDCPTAILKESGDTAAKAGDDTRKATATAAKATAYVYIPLQNVTEKFFQSDQNDKRK
ncbi:MAG: hypothetical protein K2G86_00680 [Prevotella sp.]|nr:hypothetical protein [Prevotella sp.]